MLLGFDDDDTVDPALAESASFEGFCLFWGCSRMELKDMMCVSGHSSSMFDFGPTSRTFRWNWRFS